VQDDDMTASLVDVPIGTPVYGIGFTDAVRRFLRGYVVFHGRASRSEYWWAQLAVQLYVLAVSLLATVLLVVMLVATIPTSSSSQGGGTAAGLGLGAVLAFYGVLIVLIAPVTLPTYSAGARRLRDAGFSPWLLLLGLVPLGSYAVLVLTIMPTRPDPAWAAAAWQQQAYGHGAPGQTVDLMQPGYGCGYGYGYGAHGQQVHGQQAYGQQAHAQTAVPRPEAGRGAHGEPAGAPQHDARDQRHP
jgi:uncharacterized membrane protein YhaH (DUF805 family)